MGGGGVEERRTATRRRRRLVRPPYHPGLRPVALVQPRPDRLVDPPHRPDRIVPVHRDLQQVPDSRIAIGSLRRPARQIARVRPVHFPHPHLPGLPADHRDADAVFRRQILDGLARDPPLQQRAPPRRRHAALMKHMIVRPPALGPPPPVHTPRRLALAQPPPRRLVSDGPHRHPEQLRQPPARNPPPVPPKHPPPGLLTQFRSPSSHAGECAPTPNGEDKHPRRAGPMPAFPARAQTPSPPHFQREWGGGPRSGGGGGAAAGRPFQYGHPPPTRHPRLVIPAAA